MAVRTLFSTRHVSHVKYSNEDVERRTANDPLVLPQKRLLTPFLLDKRPPPIPTEDERIEFPFRNTNLFSETFFTWCLPLMRTGYRRTVQSEDLYKIPRGSTYDVERRTQIFMDHFNKLKDTVEREFMRKHSIEDTPTNREALPSLGIKYPPYLVLLALYKTYAWNYTLAVVCKGLGDFTLGMNTLQIRHLIEYVHNKANGIPQSKNGYGLAVGVSCLVFFFGIVMARAFNDSSFVGAEIKGVLTKVLLDKSFRLSKKSKTNFPASTITAYLGNDLSKIDLATNFFPFIVCLPIGIGITVTLLAINLGGAALSGIAWFIIITACIFYSTKFLKGWRKSVNVQTDARVKHIKEVLNNVKMIKYYAWEKPFTKIITRLRTQEMKIMLKVQFFRNLVNGFAITLPSVSALIGFLSMYGQRGGLESSSNLFSSVTLFNILTGHVALLPTALTSASDAWIAFTRVQVFLLAAEEKPDDLYNKHGFNPENPAIHINNASFDWLSEANSIETASDDGADISTSDESTKEKDEHSVNDLHHINLNIKHGEFVVITGSIGSGKSSLLAAINGDMTRLTGSVDISGDIVLCANPWIQNATVRDNITFGLDYDKKVYQAVVECCALPSDFEILPAGDMTEIGERGVNLSGGQKARINLARAVYRAYTMSEYNIIMFDDVLSAVDAKVGKHIMRECILGLLSGKTRILATHQLSLIGEADRIIYMNGDGTIDVGTETELAGRNRSFKTLMEFQMEGTEHKEEEVVDEDDEDADVHEEEVELIRKQTTKIDHDKGRTIQAETMKNNGIPLSILTTYFRSGSGKLGIKIVLPNLILAIIFTAFCMLFQNVWLSFWSSRRFERHDNFYIGIYVFVTIMFVVCSIWQFSTIIYVTNRSSNLLNIKAINNIMHAPMAFFDTTPMGRIVNRFTKDTDVLDNEIADQARMTCFGFGNMGGIIIMCCIFLPWFAIAVPILAVYVVCIFNYYQSTAREVKRLEGIKRSLVFSTFDETLQGMDTIKLYSSSKRFINKNTDLINSMNEAYFYTVGIQRWLAMALHGVSASVNLIVGLLAVSRVYPISAASSGLLVSYIVQLSMQLISFTKSLGQLEQYMSSVERVCEYVTEIPQEAPYENEAEDAKIPPNWPVGGHIIFKDVSLKYRPELPFVLKNMDLDIRPGERIGICGRTGAGKSTIMTALYRLSEIETGQMYIDGIDISKIGLFQLRSHLAIIPQDPVLFRGDIRRNLDPFGETDDNVLREALALASGSFDNDKFALDTFVEDDGSNFSLGERQVIALCRALIRKSKILILDEATSSVDYETDARIQSTIATGFQGCTILCIAHRLRTILNYDRILVMDKGECAEFDTPRALWEQNGIFRSMCDKSGIEEGDL
ncbi:hypothetical protein CAS74_003977 [Pichia kudriavzevii]|uniref:Oligomycin resistance ATP-dependent permease YOR1 n=1 Tax=Pichia kudriavzevii TaxID=4909 RepID=A0A1Z8JK66_PICKU|nr:hypothetical protein CAS74_003977 [Pichia kudriavzevii]